MTFSFVVFKKHNKLLNKDKKQLVLLLRRQF
jgi:hypothetical protein